MSSHDDEQAVLHAVESQLRTEDPQLVACFLAFNSVTPPIRSLTGRHDAGPREKRRRTDLRRYWLVVRLVIVACMLAAMIAGTIGVAVASS
jgi:Protein of unknown function (DUF3040)